MSNSQIKRDIVERCVTFAVDIVNLANDLPRTPAGFAISSQIIRSATSIGANIHEAKSAFSKKDFIHCFNISLKEARETHYWLTIMQKTKISPSKNVDLLLKENDEIIRILFIIVKNTKNNSNL